MSVLLSDIEPMPLALTVVHVKREEGGPNLCGSRFGFGVVAAEGEKVNPWPWDTTCPRCLELHPMNLDDPEQSAEFS